MKILISDAFVGEFGWELFNHQGRLRYLSKRFDKTIAACRRGHEVLYQDFAQVVPIDVDSRECDMWTCKGFVPPKLGDTFKGKVTHVSPPLCRYDHEHKLDKKRLFENFTKQDFIPFGTKNNDLKYDVLLHARAKHNKVNAGRSSAYRNWPKEKWEQLAKSLRPLKMASIGTNQESLYVDGDDLRDIELSKLCDVMASSRLLISPSSGPIHLAALCQCPHIVWWGDPYGKNNSIRYSSDWNPFKTTHIAIYSKGWDIDVDTIQNAAIKLLTNTNYS